VKLRGKSQKRKKSVARGEGGQLEGFSIRREKGYSRRDGLVHTLGGAKKKKR